MQYIGVIVIAALVFGVCFAVDKLYTRIFRSQSQHHSGTAVRLNKRYGSFGLVFFAFGVMVIFAGLAENWLLCLGGVLVMALGIGLITYYLTFGVFYDKESFVLTTFGKPSATYFYRDIRCQQLYVTTGGQVVIELHLRDGRTFQLQSKMTGVYDFMDVAFAGWLQQTGTDRASCSFYDPKNSCWFPPAGE